ncbi:MAG: hypothetical protein U0625_03485 [Phycisphaerales bacterium]
MRSTIILGAAAAAMAAFSAHAGFVGWVGVVRESPDRYAWLDVFAGMSSSSDALLAVSNATIASNQGTFVQGSTPTTSRWRPALGVAHWLDTDSFVTLGGFNDGGTWYCGDGTTGGPDFTNYATQGATTIPPGADWYASDPNSQQIRAVPISSFLVNGGGIAGGSAAAQFGVWVAHFYIDQEGWGNQGSVSFGGSAIFGSGTTALDNRTLVWGPAPGGLIAFALMPMVSRGRRRRAFRRPSAG